jgi:hypothetical protein
MAKNKAKKPKKIKSLSKLLESLKNIKTRIPTPPPTIVMKDHKKYDRRKSKLSLKKSNLDD